MLNSVGRYTRIIEMYIKISWQYIFIKEFESMVAYIHIYIYIYIRRKTEALFTCGCLYMDEANIANFRRILNSGELLTSIFLPSYERLSSMFYIYIYIHILLTYVCIYIHIYCSSRYVGARGVFS